jgi:hypothetical protein
MGGNRTLCKQAQNGQSDVNPEGQGSREGSTNASEGSKTDLLEAIKFIQSLPLTLEEKADAVRKLIGQTPSPKL